jgi:hypothetical protein
MMQPGTSGMKPLSREGTAGMAVWQRHIFAFMKRNCTHVINHYHLPGWSKSADALRYILAKAEHICFRTVLLLLSRRQHAVQQHIAPFSDHSGRIFPLRYG